MAQNYIDQFDEKIQGLEEEIKKLRLESGLSQRENKFLVSAAKVAKRMI